MKSSSRIAATEQGACGLSISARVWFCFVILLAFAAVASAQTAVNPATNTILFSGTGNTAPQGGIVLYGTAISAFTGQPVRHLWVSDSHFSVCRMDPELDAPGPWAINGASCTYSVNRGGGAIPLGGPFAYDPAHKFLYFVDNNTASQGVIRIGFNPDGDSGHGALDFTTSFTLAGGQFTRKGPFAGGTGCPYPGPAVNRARPNGIALSPLGDLYVGFSDGGEILRFISPATADQFGFSSCDQFVQVIATTPDGVASFGLGFIGHDLWSGDGTSPFVIPNADTTCLVPPNPACSVANGTVVPQLAAVGAPGAMTGDQVYPGLSGNNLYIATGTDVAWVGNVAAGPAGQTLDLTYFNTAGIAPAPNPALVPFITSAMDATDPANVVSYVAEDPEIVANPLAIGGGRWWQTSQPIDPNGVPGAPQHVVAVAGDSQITLSWSPAQSAVPVTSYTVRNTFISAGAPLADITVSPAPGGLYPPTSLLIPGLTNNVTYGFEVAANNGNRTSPFSDEARATPPGVAPPNAPTGATAVAGDTQAFVTWTVSNGNGGSPITSYTVTVLSGGIPTGATVTVPPPNFLSNTQSALIAGLTNGTPYTFTVHATNIAGDSPESAPSNEITPSSANVTPPTVSSSGPTSESVTPAQLTYTITVTNNSLFPANNVAVTETLNTVPDNISTVSRDANGIVTVTTAAPTNIIFNETVTIAGVLDPSFNGTFLVTNAPDATHFTYSQAGLGLPIASSVSGTATVQPTANILSVLTSQGICTNGGPGVASVACTIGFMDPGAVVQINIIVQMQTQTITNTSTVSGTDFAGTPLPTATSTITTTAPTASVPTTTTDLQVSGSAQNGGPTVTGTLPTGAPDSYNWQIKNATSTPANNVNFTQTMPAALVFDSVTTDLPIDLGSCLGPAPGTAGGTVTCHSDNLGGTRKNGAKPVQQFKVTVNVHVVQVGTISSTGSVTFAGTDTNPKNNSVTVNINAK
jgi:uncharacterized repeat protein (TIGR01451 family)